jgi:hypothetical protein
LGFPPVEARAILPDGHGKIHLISPTDQRRLKALIKDRNAPQKHVWRAEIVLFTANGVGTNEIMRLPGKTKTCVWR